MLRRAVWQGLVAGLAGAAVMTATGAVADALASRDGAGPGQRHAALHPGRRSDVGPLPRAAAHAESGRRR
ncbi:hypothetical protein [Micromonospora sp. NPDC005206]|uniref:hypothetical protein n=1 Tax=Micromonospora sp. NPDC005206 TaxID=3157022 RepID=UPI0033BBBC77